MRDDEGALPGEGVDEVGDDLHRRVGLARAGRADDHAEPRVHGRTQRVDLLRREAGRIHARLVLGVRAGLERIVRLHRHHGLCARLAARSSSGTLDRGWDVEPVRRRRSLAAQGELHLGLRERLDHMSKVEEGVEKVVSLNLLIGGQIPVGRGRRVAVDHVGRITISTRPAR